MSRTGRAFVVALAVATGSGGVLVGSEAPSGAGTPQPSSSSEGTGQQVELRFDETAEYRDLKLRWLEVEDSRCPIGVQCVWAGQVVVTVEATRGEEGPVELELVLRVGRDPRAVRAFAHELLLKGVDPPPRPGVTPERSHYLALLEITRP